MTRFSAPLHVEEPTEQLPPIHDEPAADTTAPAPVASAAEIRPKPKRTFGQWAGIATSCLLIGSGLTAGVDWVIDGETDIINAITDEARSSQWLQDRGIVEEPLGAIKEIDEPGAAEGSPAPSQDIVPEAIQPDPATNAEAVTVTKDPSGIPRNSAGLVPAGALNFTSDELGMPAGTEGTQPGDDLGLEDIDLSGVSQGGGYGPEGDYDWSNIGPTTVQIPQANLTIPWVPKGVRDVGSNQVAMNLPVSFQAGWLSSSAPVNGSSGSTVIAGHVNWADGSYAPMSNLYNARSGMGVYTSDASGHIQKWKVTGVDTVNQSELSTLFNLTDSGERQLILITCEATVNPDGSITYNKNHIVTAVPA